MMRFLLDTQLLLWAAAEPAKLSPSALAVMEGEAHELWFSAASIWEVAIKSGLGRPDFSVDARVLRSGLLRAGYAELSINGEHAELIGDLPMHHKDPFDRILVAQSTIESISLVTSDRTLANYGSTVVME